MKSAEKPSEQDAASESESKSEDEGRPGAEEKPVSDSASEAQAPSGALPAPVPRTKASGAASIAPESQIRDWLKQARREQAAGHPGKAYVMAADASGLVRRVKDAGQRAALQAEVDALLAAVEPAVERSTRAANTRTDDKPLIEK